MSYFDKIKLAAAEGEPLSRIALAECYAHGIETERDVALAIATLEAAANDGLAAAAAYLEMIYAEGLWGEKNSHKAEFWLSRAVNMGDAGALFELGSELEKNAVNNEQKNEALLCYRRSAEAGNSFAALRLFAAYSFGDLGNSVNQELATHYSSLQAKLHEQLMRKLSSESNR